MRIGRREFKDEGKVYVMGILNVTPDSFSDGGRYCGIDNALDHTENMIAEGADIIDVGAESTRPGYEHIDVTEEIKRLIPVINAIRARYDVPISVDTYHPEAAKAAAEAGADMINDIWGLRYDELSSKQNNNSSHNTQSMADVVSSTGVSVCIMHNSPQEIKTIGEVNDSLKESIRIAKDAGIPDNRIMLDPGVGFAKSYQMNLSVIAKLDSFKELGYPLLLGTSRKSVIGLTLDVPVSERLEGTLVTSVYAVLGGCSFVRVHDIESNIRAIRMAEAIKSQR